MEIVNKFIEKNGFIWALFIVSFVILLADFISKKVFKNKVPSPALAIVFGLILAYYGGALTAGEKGIADLKLFVGFGTLGGSMFRDFSIVATAFGASILLMKKSGLAGFISLVFGISIAFVSGALLAFLLGYRDAVSICTLGAGACTYIVGPVTGAALGASSDIIALSIGAGVVKACMVAIFTPILAKKIGLNNPETAMVYGGMMGTNAGVMAGLAATDAKLVPYGALTATFYTGLGCLVCPSLFFLVLKSILEY